MQLLYKASVLKQLHKISLQDRKKILIKLELLQTNPYSGKILKGELSEFRSLRSWPYRIIYTLTKNTITIYSIAHRQGVYK